MPISSTSVPELGLGLRIYSGKITMTDLRAGLRAGLDHPHYAAGTAEIDDLLSIDHVDIACDEMMAFAKDAQAYNLCRGFATTHCFWSPTAPAKTLFRCKVFHEFARRFLC